MAQDIGKRIHQLRKEKKLSQEALAENAGITSVYLSKIETGKAANVSFSIISHIAAALDVSIDYLMTGKQAAVAEPQAGYGTIPYNPAVMQDVIRDVAQIIEDENLHFAPEQLAKLFTLAYEWTMEKETDEERREVKGKVIEFMRAAS